MSSYISLFRTWKLRLPPFIQPMEPVVLRESIRARTIVAPVALLSTLTSILLYIPFLLSQDIRYLQIALWAVPIFVLILARTAFSRQILKRLDNCSEPELLRADQLLRVSSVSNQIVVGLGVWIIQAPDDNSFAVPLFMTLIVVIWAIGALANLFSDFRSVIYSLPFLIGSNAAFWMMQGDFGIAIGLSMLLAGCFMVLLAYRGASIFRESVLMRFEKDQLVQRVELEREKVQRALRDTQAADEAKAFFMAAASHDIKQPLQALGLLTDTLLMSNPSPVAVPILQRQRASISQMSAQFDALMDIGRFQAGHFSVQVSRVRLAKVLDRIDAEIAPMCADKGLTWRLNIDDVLVSTDEELLLRVLRNLLTNAVQYTDHGEVSCTTKMQPGFVFFAITDTGCGIAPQHHQSIFREFVRLGDSEPRSSGAGLGLSIVTKIDSALDMKLQMTSKEGEGTRFSFQLPVSPGA
ncbi:MAG: HAMP domain-containing sensor histidine kinase [Halioglobus sp.]